MLATVLHKLLVSFLPTKRLIFIKKLLTTISSAMRYRHLLVCGARNLSGGDEITLSYVSLGGHAGVVFAGPTEAGILWKDFTESA